MKKITKKSVFICSLVYCLTGLLVLLISQSNSNITTQRTSLIQMIYNDETQIKSSNTESGITFDGNGGGGEGGTHPHPIKRVKVSCLVSLIIFRYLLYN